MAKRNYKEADYTIDTSFFADAIVDQLTEGKAYFDKSTVGNLLSFFGSNRAIAEALVGEGVYSNVNSAMRQLQRMQKNPNLKVSLATQDKLDTLNIYDDLSSTMISIVGHYTYDGSRWAFGSFDYRPTDEQLRSIIFAARPSNRNRNEDAINAFLDAYGVGVNLSFSTDSYAEIVETR